MRLKKTLKGNAYVVTGYPTLDQTNQHLADQGVGILRQYKEPKMKPADYLYKQSMVYRAKRIQLEKLAICFVLGIIIGKILAQIIWG